MALVLNLDYPPLNNEYCQLEGNNGASIRANPGRICRVDDEMISARTGPPSFTWVSVGGVILDHLFRNGRFIPVLVLLSEPKLYPGNFSLGLSSEMQHLWIVQFAGAGSDYIPTVSDSDPGNVQDEGADTLEPDLVPESEAVSVSLVSEIVPPTLSEQVALFRSLIDEVRRNTDELARVPVALDRLGEELRRGLVGVPFTSSSTSAAGITLVSSCAAPRFFSQPQSVYSEVLDGGVKDTEILVNGKESGNGKWLVDRRGEKIHQIVDGSDELIKFYGRHMTVKMLVEKCGCRIMQDGADMREVSHDVAEVGEPG